MSDEVVRLLWHVYVFDLLCVVCSTECVRSVEGGYRAVLGTKEGVDALYIVLRRTSCLSKGILAGVDEALLRRSERSGFNEMRRYEVILISRGRCFQKVFLSRTVL